MLGFLEQYKVSKPDISIISSEKLKSIINRAYRDNATIWNKSTADAIRYTKQTGELVQWSDHLQKWQDLINGLQKLLNWWTLNEFETKIATSILNDTKNAMNWN